MNKGLGRVNPQLSLCSNAVNFSLVSFNNCTALYYQQSGMLEDAEVKETN